MRALIRWLKRIFFNIIGFGLIEREDSASVCVSYMESMHKRLAELKASAARIIANSYRLERQLSEEQKQLTNLEGKANQAEPAEDLQLCIESCKARVGNLMAQVEAAHLEANEAKRELALFQEEIKDAQNRARDAQISYQLAKMKTQVEELSIASTFEEEIKAIEQMELRANNANARAEAVSELNAALRPADINQEIPADNLDIQQESEQEQQIIDSSSSEQKPD